MLSFNCVVYANSGRSAIKFYYAIENRLSKSCTHMRGKRCNSEAQKQTMPEVCNETRGLLWLNLSWLEPSWAPTQPLSTITEKSVCTRVCSCQNPQDFGSKHISVWLLSSLRWRQPALSTPPCCALENPHVFRSVLLHGREFCFCALVILYHLMQRYTWHHLHPYGPRGSIPDFLICTFA